MSPLGQSPPNNYQDNVQAQQYSDTETVKLLVKYIPCDYGIGHVNPSTAGLVFDAGIVALFVILDVYL